MEPRPPRLDIDADLKAEELNLTVFEDICQLEPYGAENIRPIFTITDARIVSFKVVGADQKHLQLKIILGESELDCIGFNMGYLITRLDSGNKISLAGELMADTWQGIKKLKMRLLDLHFPEVEPEAIISSEIIQEPILTEPTQNASSN